MGSKQIKIDLRDYILADATVAAAIVDRLYPSHARETPTAPYAVYSVTSDVPNYTHDDQNGGGTPQRETVWQIDIFGETAVSAEDVCDAIRARVEATKFTQGSTDFGAVFVDTEFDNFEDVPRDDGRAGLFRKTLQIRTTLNT